MNYSYQHRRPKEHSAPGKGIFVKLARQTAITLCMLMVVLMLRYAKTETTVMINEKIEEIVMLDYTADVVKEATKYYSDLETWFLQLTKKSDMKTSFKLEALPIQGKITSGFGKRINPITKLSEVHEGIDISVKQGSDISLLIPGVVEKAGEAGNLGLAIVIDHQNGFRTVYGHLSKVDVKVGEQVDAGTVIAKSGNTGLSTGAHLHFEVRQGKDAVDPMKLLVGQPG